jgi:hypothetical protein
MFLEDGRDVMAFTAFWAVPHEIAGYMANIYARPDYPRELRITQSSGSPSLLPQLYNPPYRLYQLWTPEIDPTVTVLYPNYQDGGHSLVHSIVRLFGVRAVSLRLSSLKVPYPICEFTLHERSPQTRIIRVMKDSKWEFFTMGTEQSFEQLDRYARRVVRERFDISMAASYCQSLGVDIASPKFWTTSNCSTMNFRA